MTEKRSTLRRLMQVETSALIVAAGVLALAGGVAYATIPDANGVVHGCYNTVNGNLRVIDAAAGQTCKNSEAALNWNLVGPAGIPGAPGAPGAPGTPGTPGEDGATVADVLLRVHRSYLPIIRPHLRRVHALAHITGGGIPGNLNRALPDSLDAVVRTGTWQVPNVFRQLGDAGGVPRDEQFRAFNMGVGLMALVDPADAGALLESAAQAGVNGWVAGEVVPGSGAVRLEDR